VGICKFEFFVVKLLTLFASIFDTYAKRSQVLASFLKKEAEGVIFLHLSANEAKFACFLKLKSR